MTEVIDKTKNELVWRSTYEDSVKESQKPYEPPESYEVHGRKWRRVKWNSKAVMYEGVFGYEVHKYRARYRNEFVLQDGKKRRTKLPKGYILPEDEDFGYSAWSFGIDNKDLAERKFEELSNG